MAYQWMSERWRQALDVIRPELRDRLEDAELYHEILEHNWYLSERSNHEVPLLDAVDDYVATVLAERPDERDVIEG